MKQSSLGYFDAKFPNHQACLNYIIQEKGNIINPLSSTIFRGSTTDLRSWFYAIFKFANSRNGVSAKELQRDLGVTYKTAWRIGKQIRSLFSEDNIDEASFAVIYAKQNATKYVQKVKREYVTLQGKSEAINNNFFGQMKRSFDGTYHNVSSKYGQYYVDEFAFKYNNRNNGTDLFSIMLQRALTRKPI